jgi:hypothetical protein
MNAARWFLSLAFWREFLFEKQRHGATASEMHEQSGEFAYHLGAAIRILLAPWRRGTLKLRRNLLRKIVAGMDRIAVANEEMAWAHRTGRVTDIVIRDVANSFIEASEAQAEQLAMHLRAQRDFARRRGETEEEIALAILSGVAGSDEGVPM